MLGGVLPVVLNLSYNPKYMESLISTSNIQLRGWLRTIVSMPFIYAVFIPLVLLDIVVALYHRVAFPLYGIPLVDRRKHIVFDRQKLSYLTTIEKLNCVYCSYANGLLSYVKAIAGETEKMWCPIKHQWHPLYQAPEHHASFANYNDAELLVEYMKKRNVHLNSSSSPMQKKTIHELAK